MDSVLRRRLAAMLIVFGVLGLVMAVALLPHGLAAVGFARFLNSPLVYGILARDYALAVVMVLSALLFVVGHRIGHIGAGLGVAIVVSYLVANWRVQIAVAAIGDPRAIPALILALAIGTAVVSVLALVSARCARSGVAPPRRADPTDGVYA